MVPAIAVAQPSETIILEPIAELTLLTVDNPKPPQVELPSFILCNCWAYVKSVYPSLPRTATILSNLSASGNVAVFYYPKVDLYHYAVVLYETDTHYVIEETNYSRCKKGMRNIPKDDKSLLGFFPTSQ